MVKLKGNSLKEGGYPRSQRGGELNYKRFCYLQLGRTFSVNEELLGTNIFEGELVRLLHLGPLAKVVVITTESIFNVRI